MKPTMYTLDLVLQAAKNAVAKAISDRDHSNTIALEEINIRVTDTSQPPWVAFVVQFIYVPVPGHPDPNNDDIEVLVPWNAAQNTLGDIKAKVF